jgi:hypothetical protein
MIVPRSSFMIALTLLVLIAPDTACAQRTIPLNIEGLVRESAQIFAARVVDVSTGVRDEETGLMVTRITFAVQESFYGTPGSVVTMKQYGGEADGFSFYPAGLPRYRVGEEVIVMLHGPSDIGFQSPVGMEQGKFNISVDAKSGRRLVSNSLQNENLLTNLRHPEKVKKKALLKKSPGPIEYADFASMLRSYILEFKR